MALFCDKTGAQDVSYILSRYSEDYNTNYLFCCDFDDNQKDTIVYLNTPLPKAFVMEIGALKEGEQMDILYNGDKELLIANYKGRITINGKRIGRKISIFSKLSLYYVNGNLIVYQDDKKMKTFKFFINNDKRIGLKISRKERYVCRMWNIYEPSPFKEADYGAALEEGDLKKTKNVRAVPHNVGKDYNLTFPTDITRHSKRSIRFEYRFQDSKENGASNMRRGRSEISGVFSYSPKNKWIIEYDLYIPNETKDDEDVTEIITQIHEGSATPTSPSFCLFMRGGFLCATVKGDSRNLAEWVSKSKPTFNVSERLIFLQKDRWYHIKIFVKEGWRQEDMPLTRIWVDGTLRFESNTPNCFKYQVTNKSNYDYLKFGVYKSGWLKKNRVEKEKQRRIYYFDNFTVKH